MAFSSRLRRLPVERSYVLDVEDAETILDLSEFDISMWYLSLVFSWECFSRGAYSRGPVWRRPMLLTLLRRFFRAANAELWGRSMRTP
jgi:hypothetical protein